jgi:hypothetical protein
MTKDSRSHSQIRERQHGVFFTVSNPSKLQQASRALLSLLNPLCDTADSCEDECTIQESAGKTVSEQIAAELGALKATSRKIWYAGELCRGIGHIVTKKPVSPSQLIHSLFAGDLPMMPPLFISRILPVEWTCAPNQKSFTAVMLPVVSANFKAFTNDVTWKLVFEKHSLTDMTKDGLINALHDSIEARHEVSIYEPQITILVQITTQVCGVALVEDFDKFEAYNLRKFIISRGIDSR